MKHTPNLTAPRIARRMVGGAMVLLTLVNAAGPVSAAASCFRPAEMEADQAMRFQTRLMVVSDSCGAETYRRFTIRNREVIASYQHAMIEHFRRSGAPRAEATFDSFLTRLANDYSLQAGEQPVAALCSQSAGFLAQADALDKSRFRHYVSELAVQKRPDYTVCAD